MGALQDQITATLMPGMSIPRPLELLFNWIERNGYFEDVASGDYAGRYGYLSPTDATHSGWTETSRPGGTFIEFHQEGNKYMHHWLGNDDPAVLNRLCIFAKTGADGSKAGFWLDDAGHQRIVHLGSGSGSVLTCILADDPIDFLRLLAIGYDEICWSEDWHSQPDGVEGSYKVLPNQPYRDWVEATFSTSIPRTAFDIVKHPAGMDDDTSEDLFWQWVSNNCG